MVACPFRPLGADKLFPTQTLAKILHSHLTLAKTASRKSSMRSMRRGPLVDGIEVSQAEALCRENK